MKTLGFQTFLLNPEAEPSGNSLIKVRDRDNSVPDLRILLELSYANAGVGGAWVYIKRYLEALLRMIQDSDDFRVHLFRASSQSQR